MRVKSNLIFFPSFFLNFTEMWKTLLIFESTFSFTFYSSPMSNFSHVRLFLHLHRLRPPLLSSPVPIFTLPMYMVNVFCVLCPYSIQSQNFLLSFLFLFLPFLFLYEFSSFLHFKSTHGYCFLFGLHFTENNSRKSNTTEHNTRQYELGKI